MDDIKILAIDSSGLTASVAVVSTEKIIAQLLTDNKKTHSETLLPMVDAALTMAGLGLAEMDYVAVTSGPGSFTGLRIGAATAKGLCFGQNKRLIPVPTLDALAYNVVTPGNGGNLIVPILDARRDSAYTAIYRCGIIPERLTDYICESIDEIIKRVETLSGGGTAIFLGDGVPVFRETIETNGIRRAFAPPHLCRVTAAAVGALALTMMDKAVDCAVFEPFYIRKPQAEREYESRADTEWKMLKK